MKKSVSKTLKFTTALSMLLGVHLLVLTNKGAEKVDGYSASSLPTTIDLNDTSATNIRSYYSSLNNLSTSERQGTNLLKNLKTILKNGQKYYSYENGTSIWQMYEITDRDWDKSPASSTTYGTYNPTTNKITGYTYGTSASSSKNNPYIHALYINRDVNNQTTAWDNHNQDQWGINREHVWPKAEGFDSSGAGGARGDPMHLMAGNGYANNIHSNYYYGYVKTSGDYTDCGNKYSNQSGNLRGTSKTLNSGTVFEPQDCDKGDIARAIFYMVARYNYLSGSDSDGIDTNNPNLTLTQNISDWSSSGYTSSTSTQGKLGVLTDLLAWHHADPVDEYEKHRNNLLYTNFTNNRNPFIDFPEWVDFIWGTATYNGTSYQSYSSTPTGYATPSSDTINGYNDGGETEIVSVTGVSLNKETTSITIGESEALSATVAPSNATDQSVTWSTSNTGVATVTSTGRVTAVAEGNATITVATNDGGFTDTCSVSVTSSGGGGGASETTFDLYSGSLVEGDYIIYYGGKAMNNTVSSNRLQYEEVTPVEDSISDASESIIWHIAPSGNYWTIYNSAVGKYAAGTGTKNQAELNTSSTDNKSLWTSSGTSTYEFVNKNNSSSSVNANLRNNGTYGFACYSTSTGGALSLYKATEHSVPTTKVLSSISIDTDDVETTFYMNEEFEYGGLSVTAYYEDGSFDTVSGFTVSTPDFSTSGQKTVTVSYTVGEITKTATYTITVLSVTLSSISLSNPKTSYYVDDAFEKPTVTATFSNSETADVTDLTSFTGYNLSTTGNQTVTVSYTFNGTTKITSYSITIVEIPAESGTENNPYTVEQARAAITAAGSGTLLNKFTKGIIYKIDSYNSTYHSITYWISDDGTSLNPLEVYSGKGIDGANFSSIDDLSVGDIVVVKGELKKFNDIFEYNYDNELVSRIPAINENAYSLVTDISQLLTGDEIIFVSNYSSTYYNATTISGDYLRAETTTVESDIATKSSNALAFTIEKNGNNYNFYNSDLGYIRNNASQSAAVKTESTVSANSTFSISINSTTGVSTIAASSGNYKYFRFYRNSNSSYWFNFTSSSSYNRDVYIYKKTAQILADEWSQTFLNGTSDGTTCSVSNWSSLASSYKKLAETVQNEIINVDANPSTDYSLRAQAMARYDFFMSDPRFNQGEHFIVGRASSSNARPFLSLLATEQNKSLFIVILCSIIGVSSIGCYYFIKFKKREE